MNINNTKLNIAFKSDLIDTDDLTAGEFFAGGGGVTESIEELEGITTKWILNHDEIAVKTNAFNHKNVKVFWADVYSQDERELDPVDYVHASVDCSQHSGANAGKNKKMGYYTMGWELYRYLKHLNPLVISIENVPEFKKWAPVDSDNQPIKERMGEEFERWKKAIMDLGYEYKESIRNAADDGIPTRRVRFFCFFYRPGITISFPDFTHSKVATTEKPKWEACRPYINTNDEGVSIFGRKYNESLKRHLRKPLVSNSLKRIAGGIKKFHPEFHQLLIHLYAGDTDKFHALLAEIQNTQGEEQKKALAVEKLHFIMDYCRTDNYHSLDQPLNPQLTWQTKQYVSINNFICQFYGGSLQTQSLEDPLNTVTTIDRHQLLRLEKIQFIAMYFNSNGSPERNLHSLDDPLAPVLTEPKHQLITLLDNFDVKARFLTPNELAACSTFPEGYFDHPELKLSHKNAVRLIGNAVPPKWAKLLIGPNINSIRAHKSSKMSA